MIRLELSKFILVLSFFIFVLLNNHSFSALDLVEKLYNDLVTTTKSYQFLQTKESKLVNDLQSLQSQLFPLRKENAKLARENNELHLDHIRQIEENRNTIDNFTGQIRKLNEEIMQLKLLNKVSTDQLKSKDSLIEKLREVNNPNSFDFISI